MSHIIIAVQGSSFTPTFLNCLLDTFQAIIKSGNTFSYIIRDTIMSYDNFIETVKSDIKYDSVVFIDSHCMWNPEWIVNIIKSENENLAYGCRDVFIETDFFDVTDINGKPFPLSTRDVVSGVILNSINILKLSKNTVDGIGEVVYNGEKFPIALSSMIKNLHCDFSKVVVKV